MRYRKNEQGFTLIELMATLVILALIIAIAVPAIGKLVTKANDQADQSSIALMERAGEMAELDGLKFDDENPAKPESITAKDVYMIPTLIEQGYLKLDDASKFNKPENYVKKVNKSGKFVYMGQGNTTPGETPNEDDNAPQLPEDDISDYRYEFFDGGTKTRVLEYLGSKTEIVIPRSFEGKPTVEIGVSMTTDEIEDLIMSGGQPPDGVMALAMKNFSSVVIPKSVTKIGYGAFAMNKLTSIDFPSNVTVIGGSSFAQNPMTAVTIPSNVREIGGGAFADTPLTSLTLNSGLKIIGNGAFSQTLLTSVRIPGSVDLIDATAFLNVPLKSLVIEEGVKEIRHRAFMGTVDSTSAYPPSELTDVTLPSSLTRIGTGAFWNVPLETVTVLNPSMAYGTAEEDREKYYIGDDIDVTDVFTYKYMGTDQSFMTLRGATGSTTQQHATAKRFGFTAIQ